jgi:branched-chain amino acid transport system permease protein
VKLTAFVLSAVLAGSTGALAAHFLNTWNARQGSFDTAVTMLAFVILGGSRSWLGPVLGGLLLTALPELLRPVGDVRLVLFGLVILLGPSVFPQGLITPGLLERMGRLGERAEREPQP